MNGVFKFLLQHLFARVPGQLQQEETCVGLWQEVVRGVVLIQHLRTEDDSALTIMCSEATFCVLRYFLPGGSDLLKSLLAALQPHAHDKTPGSQCSRPKISSTHNLQ